MDNSHTLCKNLQNSSLRSRSLLIAIRLLNPTQVPSKYPKEKEMNTSNAHSLFPHRLEKKIGVLLCASECLFLSTPSRRHNIFEKTSPARIQKRLYTRR
jgi:hypothetical protein